MTKNVGIRKHVIVLHLTCMTGLTYLYNQALTIRHNKTKVGLNSNLMIPDII